MNLFTLIEPLPGVPEGLLIGVSGQRRNNPYAEHRAGFFLCRGHYLKSKPEIRQAIREQANALLSPNSNLDPNAVLQPGVAALQIQINS